MSYGRVIFRAACAVLLCVLAQASAAALTPPPNPPPPAGWEAEVTPGFEPSVESVVATASSVNYQNGPALWKDWGDGAFAVLMKLSRDTRWELYYRWKMVTLLNYAPPSVQALMLARLKEIEALSTPDEGDRATMLVLVRGLKLPEAERHLLQRFEELSALSSVSPAQVDELAAIVQQVPRGDEFVRRVEDAALKCPVDGRRDVYLLFLAHSRDGEVTSLRRMAAEGDEDLKARASKLIEERVRFKRPLEALGRVAPAPFGDGRGDGSLSKKELKSLGKEISSWAKKDPEDGAELADKVKRYAAAGGDDSVRVLYRVASDYRYPREVRSEALCAFGRIGSEKSVGAFRKLRGPIRAESEDAPVRHIDSMAQAAVAFAYDGRDSEIPAEPWAKQAQGAWISADYRDGAVQLGRYVLTLRRFGDDWVPVRADDWIQY